MTTLSELADRLEKIAKRTDTRYYPDAQSELEAIARELRSIEQPVKERVRLSIDEHRPDAKYAWITATYEDGAEESLAGIAGRIKRDLAEYLVARAEAVRQPVNGEVLELAKRRLACSSEFSSGQHLTEREIDKVCLALLARAEAAEKAPQRCQKCAGTRRVIFDQVGCDFRVRPARGHENGMDCPDCQSPQAKDGPNA